MTFLVTYCCRDKEPAPGPMPARDRYLSPRIQRAEEAARLVGWDFVILSGLHGLLGPGDDLAWYDHLLTLDQVEEHAVRCAGQLAGRRADAVVMLSRREAVDPGVGPYRVCLEQACSVAGIPFRLVEIGAETPSAEKMAVLLDPE